MSNERAKKPLRYTAPALPEDNPISPGAIQKQDSIWKRRFRYISKMELTPPLSEKQQAAVKHGEGPLLIIAGAGRIAFFGFGVGGDGGEGRERD